MALLARRSFLKSAAFGVAASIPGLGRAAAAGGHALGIDNYAVRSMGWKARRVAKLPALFTECSGLGRSEVGDGRKRPRWILA